MATYSAEGRDPRGTVRLPAAAGYFYPADPDELRRELAWCFAHPLGPGDPPVSVEPATAPLAIMSPHAGLRYSGPFAANAYSHLAPVHAAVVVGPNHRGRGAALSLAPATPWRTPLGDVPPDSELVEMLRERCPELQVDARAHAFEHSVELQAIFLQHALGPNVRLVAVAAASLDFSDAAALGHALARVATDRPVLLVASTDLSHYLPDRATRERDGRALAALQRLDVEGLARLLAADDATLCGAVPTLAVAIAARELGATTATLLRYGTSADTGGDSGAVVGYAAMRIERSGSAPVQRK